MTTERAGYVVVDVWKVKPGKANKARSILAEAYELFTKHPDILSVDYCLVDDSPDRYLVVFRYTSADAREAFVGTPELENTMARLKECWDLDDIFVKGPAAPLGA